MSQTHKSESSGPRQRISHNHTVRKMNTDSLTPHCSFMCTQQVINIIKMSPKATLLTCNLLFCPYLALISYLFIYLFLLLLARISASVNLLNWYLLPDAHGLAPGSTERKALLSNNKDIICASIRLLTFQQIALYSQLHFPPPSTRNAAGTGTQPSCLCPTSPALCSAPLCSHTHTQQHT